jgi:hypothetical protein
MIVVLLYVAARSQDLTIVELILEHRRDSTLVCPVYHHPSSPPSETHLLTRSDRI